MAVKVYGAPYSTCTQRVLAVLHELGMQYDLHFVDMTKGEHKVGIRNLLRHASDNKTNQHENSPPALFNPAIPLASFRPSRTMEFIYLSPVRYVATSWRNAFSLNTNLSSL